MQKRFNFRLFTTLFASILFIQNITYGDGATGLFPFFDSIYQADTEPKLVLKTAYQFSRFYASDQGHLYTIDTLTGRLTAMNLKTHRFVEVSRNSVSWFALLSNRLLTVSKEYKDNQGFELSLFKLSKDNEAITLKEIGHTTLDLFVSDWTWFDNSVILAGSDRNDASNYVISCNIDDFSKKTIYSRPKDHDFFKILRVSNSLIVYGSVNGYHEKKQKYVRLDNLNIKGKNIVREFILPQSGYNFFGKGFSAANNRYYLPLIRENYQAELAEVGLTANTAVQMIQAPTAIYQEIEAPGSNRYFIGYNYFKDPGTFSWLRFDPDKGGFSSKRLHRSKNHR